jgi:2-keto-4-pentenoate hydratase/2-oxohepta-3-ene-1,7-dioic acid hydratase in catechol pathway
VLDLAALAQDLASERGAVRHGRGGFPKTLQGLIEGGATALAAAREAAAHGAGVLKREGVGGLAAKKLGVPLAKARLEAPLPRPARNVFCLGRNYKEHAAERGAEAPPHPVYFTKAPECVLAPGGKIVHHVVTKELDYEVELTVVIGEGGRDIPRAEALRHVFGYTVINDVSARDLQKSHLQWFKGKSLDGFCPIGPVVVTADEFGDPQSKQISLRVNGVEKQHSNTSLLIFDIPTLIEYISATITLDQSPGSSIAFEIDEVRHQGVDLARLEPVEGFEASCLCRRAVTLSYNPPYSDSSNMRCETFVHARPSFAPDCTCPRGGLLGRPCSCRDVQVGGRARGDDLLRQEAG